MDCSSCRALQESGVSLEPLEKKILEERSSGEGDRGNFKCSGIVDAFVPHPSLLARRITFVQLFSKDWLGPERSISPVVKQIRGQLISTHASMSRKGGSPLRQSPRDRRSASSEALTSRTRSRQQSRFASRPRPETSRFSALDKPNLLHERAQYTQFTASVCPTHPLYCTAAQTPSFRVKTRRLEDG